MPLGKRRVEELDASNAVMTADGETRPVLWVGRQTIVTALGLGLARLPPARQRSGFVRAVAA
ncbi:Hint domain-containing protein [Chelatococcus reniformis]|uniref:Hint domain-containing protein n=1 Tax=Chelatococcus reniformis TaxID=1494448 RepID=UPI0035715C6E